MVRLGGAVCAAAVLLVLLASCGNTDVNEFSDAFVGPRSSDLIASPSTNCALGRISPGDAVQISGFDFTPDSVVELRWIIEAQNDTGTWKSVLADSHGNMTAEVRITRKIARPGDLLTLQAQGEGASGLMMLAVELEVAKCGQPGSETRS